MARATISKRAPKKPAPPAAAPPVVSTVAKGDIAIAAPDGFRATVHTSRWSLSKSDRQYPAAVALANGAAVTVEKANVVEVVGRVFDRALAKGADSGAAAVPPMPATAGVLPGLQTATMREFFLPPGIVPGAHGVLLMRRGDDGSWSAKLGKTLRPAVLEKDAEMPVGSSALPPSLERVVPPGFEYWKIPDPVQARKIRDALVEKNFFDEALLRVVDGEIRLCAQKLFLYEPDVAHARKSCDAVIKSLAVKSGAPQIVTMAPEASTADLAKVLALDGCVALISPSSASGVEAAIDALVVAAKSAGGAHLLLAVEDSPGARADITRAAPVFKIDATGADDFVFAASFDPGAVSWVAKEEPPAAPAPAEKDHATDPDSVKYVTAFRGIPVWINRPTGFVQTVAKPDGSSWSRTYTADYGEIPGAAGGDGEDLDVFLGPDPEAPTAFWIEQHFADGTFDEFKVFLGYPDEAAARKIYAAHVPPELAGECAAVPVTTMRSLLGIPPRDLIATAEQIAARDAPVMKLAKAAVSPDGAAQGAEQHFVLGVVLEPDVVDSQNDTYSAAEVEKTAHDWMENYLKTGLMHQGDVSEKVRPVESYIAPQDFEINGQPVKAGSWILGVHILDNDLWTAVKAGDLTGFSIGGSAIRKPDAAATAKHKAGHALLAR